MPAIRISDLAEVMIRELARFHGHDPKAIEIKVTGPRPGEKLYEELMNEEETRRSWELSQYYVIYPAFAKERSEQVNAMRKGRPVEPLNPYNTRNIMHLSQTELKDFLHASGLLTGN